MCSQCFIELNETYSFYQKIKKGLEELESQEKLEEIEVKTEPGSPTHFFVEEIKVEPVAPEDESVLEDKVEEPSNLLSLQECQPVVTLSKIQSKESIPKACEEVEPELLVPLSDPPTQDDFAEKFNDDDEEDELPKKKKRRKKYDSDEEDYEPTFDDEWMEQDDEAVNRKFNVKNRTTLEYAAMRTEEKLFEAQRAKGEKEPLRLLNDLPDIEIRMSRLRANPTASKIEKRRMFYESTCFQCDKPFNDENELEAHQKQVHRFPRLYFSCCGRKYNWETCYSHMFYHLDPEPFKCVGCGLQTKSYFELKSHYSKCKVKTKCPHCDVTALSKTMRKHIASHKAPPEPKEKPKKVKAPLRSRAYSSLANPGHYECDICKKRFSTYDGIKKHLQNHLSGAKPKSENKFMCEHCAYSTNTTSSLANHIKVVHGDNTKTPCPACGKLIKSLFLKTHYNLYHVETELTTCKDCGAQFKNHRLYDKHWRRVHDKRYRFTCNECGKQYKQSFQLDDHSYTHKNTYKYSCEFCDFKVNYVRNLRVHMKTLHPEKYKDDVINRLKNLYGETMAPKSLEGNRNHIAELKIAGVEFLQEKDESS